MEKVIQFDGNRTEEEMLNQFDVDRDKRDVRRWLINTWTTTMKDENQQPTQVENYQSKLWLERKYPELVDDVADVLLKLIGDETRKTIKAPKATQQQLLGWVLEFDWHINKLDHLRTQPTKKLKKMMEWKKRLLDSILKFDPDKLLYVIGGDKFNSDGNQRTTKGIPMNNTMDEFDAFKMWLEDDVWFIEYMKQTGLPIQIIAVPWNHDYLTMKLYGESLKIYYRNDEGVEVTNSENRAYVDRWKTMMMFGHWQNEKTNNVLQLAMKEFIKKKYDHMYAYAGHWHTRQTSQNWQMIYKRVSSPWHPNKRANNKGYDMKQGMNGYLWDKKGWEIAEFTHNM